MLKGSNIKNGLRVARGEPGISVDAAGLFEGRGRISEAVGGLGEGARDSRGGDFDLGRALYGELQEDAIGAAVGVGEHLAGARDGTVAIGLHLPGAEAAEPGFS